MPSLTPISFGLTSLLVANNVARVRIHSECTIKSVYGSLRALLTGPFTVELRRDRDNFLIATLPFPAGGGDLSVDGLAADMMSGDIVAANVTTLGIGPADCQVILWVQ